MLNIQQRRERGPRRAHPHETSDGSGREGGGGERYLSRAVARARILNNSWSAEEVEDLATPGHFGFSINIPLPRPAKSVGPRAQHPISEPCTHLLLPAQFARPDRYSPPIIFHARNFHELISRAFQRDNGYYPTRPKYPFRFVSLILTNPYVPFLLLVEKREKTKRLLLLLR